VTVPSPALPRGAARVTVLLPARNAGPALDACLASLRRQSEPRWTCVAVDDASTDDTGERLRAIAAADARFEVVAGPGQGLVAALRAGLEHIGAHHAAPFIARMDADDWMHRHRLRDQLAALGADPRLDGVGCHVRLFPRRFLRDGRRRYERWLNSIDTPESLARDAFVECPIAHPTLVLRREALLEHGYLDRDWPEDLDLVLRLLAAGRRLAVVPRRRLAWRDHPGRLSRTHASYGLDRFTACKAAHLASGFLADSPDYVLWGHGPTGRAMRKALAAHGKTPARIVELHPRRLGRTIHGAPVIPPEGLSALTRPRTVVSVAGAGPRAQIRAWMRSHGYVDGIDFVCTA